MSSNREDAIFYGHSYRLVAICDHLYILDIFSFVFYHLKMQCLVCIQIYYQYSDYPNYSSSF